MSVCTNLVYVRCMCRLKEGLETLAVTRCTHVCCMVCTLYIHTCLQYCSEKSVFQNVHTLSVQRGVLA